MTATLVGYARCSTDKQDLTAQQARLQELGGAPDRIYMDRGLTGTTRARPGLDQALAAVRAGDTLVVPKLDRVARQGTDARQRSSGMVVRRGRVEGVRSGRSDGEDVLQHSGHLCRVRGRLNPSAYPRRHGHCPRQGEAEGQAT